MTFQTSDLRLDMLKGDPTQLGATPVDGGVNFALFSSAADSVELCLFSDDGRHEIGRVALPEYTNEIWHGFLPNAKPGQVYGYRVHGPFAPEQGLRFNPNKLLIDPYARGIRGEIKWDKALYGYDVEAAEDKDLTFSDLDSAAFMPKGVVTDFFAEGRAPKRPFHAWDRTAIYELHVAGYTKLHPDVPEAARGTLDGLAEDAVIQHIKSLGVTTVELMPIHFFVDDHHLTEKGLRNYWGYNSLNFFTPMERYLGPSELASFRNMVRRYHDAGLEVILDVVYNHTAEGNELGATLSFKGIDNPAYYRLMPDEPRFYINDTGTGNTINTSHPFVLRMVLDSMRHWVQVMEVDGFRFDLGTILGREPNGFDPRGGFFDAVGQDPVLNTVKLIGEPWDIGPGGYQVGGFPAGWSEWNDKYRDTVRGYWKNDPGLTRDLAARMTGSGDTYDHHGRRPWASINFVAAHDGFTLNDLVTYNEKHNEANGEDNKDGHNNNLSFNYGVEGPTDDPGILEVRERQKRNILATLFLSHGAPMLLAGDEFGRSQHGNNNAYCQDDAISWIRWDEIGERDTALLAFTRRVITLRKENAIFRRASFRDGCVIRWLNPAGGDQTPEHWDDPNAMTIGEWLECDLDEGAKRALILFNPFDGEVGFHLPEGPWRAVLDTAEPTRGDVAIEGDEYQVMPRSLVVLL